MKTTFPILILAGALLAGCGATPAPREAAAETRSAPIAVQALSVSLSEWPAVYEAVGTVRARSAAVISAKVMGYVREVRVQAGDRVRQGEVLVLLDARDPDASFEVHRKPGALAKQPFDVNAAPIEITAKARKIPAWQMEGGLVGQLQQSPAKSAEPVETITLIPMGCARLRISAFPIVGDGADAHEWKAASQEVTTLQ